MLNLSWRLIEPLSHHFNSVVHINKIPIAHPASDEAIWQYADANDFCIVTNDEDLLKLLLKKGFPPKLILLRMGNQSTTFVREILLKRAADLRELEKSEEYGLLEIYG